MTNRPKLLICRGAQASGKSTWSKQWVAEQPDKRIRISCDDIRRMFGTYWVEPREPLVQRAKLSLLDNAMQMRYDIVLDDMHLLACSCNDILILATRYDYAHQFVDFHCTLQTALLRDKQRSGDACIGKDVLNYTYSRFRSDIHNMAIAEHTVLLPAVLICRRKNDIQPITAINAAELLSKLDNITASNKDHVYSVMTTDNKLLFKCTFADSNVATFDEATNNIRQLLIRTTYERTT